MSFSDELQRELMQTFALEVQETLQRTNALLLQLEKDDGAQEHKEHFSQIFREAHNLKGAARAVGNEPISRICHALESLFSLVSRGEVEASPSLYDLVYQAVDAIGLLASTTREKPSPTVSVEAILQALAAISAPAERDERTAATSPLGPPATQPVPATFTSQHPPMTAANGKHADPDLEQEAIHASKPAAAHTADSNADETIRIAIARLDQIMAQMGELQVVRNNIAHVLTDLHGLLEEMNSKELRRRRTRLRQRRLAPLGDRQPAGHATAGADSEEMNGQANVVLNQGYLRVLTDSLAEQEASAGHIRAEINSIYQRLKLEDHRMGQVVTALQDDVHRTRLQPISTVFDTLPRMVRDIARTQGKEIDFIIEGGETEIDRSLNENIKSPLVHLLRNAVDHGIENPSDRKAANKSPQATLRLTAEQQGSNIVISVQDDGRGIDVERVIRKAREKGLISAEEAKTIDNEDALWLIFRSGFSTSDTITEISGRGIGMDVVRADVETMQGMIDVATKRGVGTTISMTLPLTVATTLVMLIKSGSQTFAIPVSNINRIMQVGLQEIGQLEGSAVIYLEEQPILLTHLGHILGIDKEAERKDGTYVNAVVLGSAEQRAAVLVDELLGIQEVVVKNLPAPLLRVHNIAGATILGTGDAVAILHVADLLRTARRGNMSFLSTMDRQRGDQTRQPQILVADDSVTTRTLEKNILESAGYQVHTASDGQEAWEILQGRTFDLLVSDVNMPRMDGLELTETIRRAPQFQSLPIILVTSLESADDHRRGADAGANAYIVKGRFDQQTLLETVQSLI